MKRTLLAIFGLMALALAEAQVLPADSLDQRDGVSYRIGSSVPYTGKAKSRIDEGGIMEVSYKEGRPNGMMRGWYPNGQLSVEGELHGSTREGLWKAWYANGQLKRKGAFKDGKEEGRFTWYSENGKLSKNGSYHAGKESGKWTWYHDNGRKMQEGVLEDGVEVGTWKEWYPDGKPKMEGSLKNGEKHGNWTWWDEAGTRREEVYDHGHRTWPVDSVDLHLGYAAQAMEDRDINGALRFLDRASALIGDHSEQEPKYMWLTIMRARVYSRFQHLEQAQTVLLRATGIPEKDVQAIVSTHDTTMHDDLRSMAARMEAETERDGHIAPHVALALVHNILQDSSAMQRHQQWMMDHAQENAKDWVIRMSLDLYRLQADKEEAYYWLGQARDTVLLKGATRKSELALATSLVDLARYEEAAPVVDKYLALDSNDLQFLILRLDIAMGSGDLDGMRRYKEAVLKVDPSALDSDD